MESGVRRPDGKIVPWSDVPQEELAKMLERTGCEGPGDISPAEMASLDFEDYGPSAIDGAVREMNNARHTGDQWETAFWKLVVGELRLMGVRAEPLSICK